MSNLKLSQEAKELRNAYQRQWRKDNKDKVKKNQVAYWERKAQEMKEQQEAK
jgi:hypothetical protein